MGNESLILADESLILADESLILVNESLILADESLILVNESLILANESLILVNESLILANESLILVNESLILANESLILVNESLNSTPLLPAPCPCLRRFRLLLNFLTWRNLLKRNQGFNHRLHNWGGDSRTIGTFSFWLIHHCKHYIARRFHW